MIKWPNIIFIGIAVFVSLDALATPDAVMNIQGVLDGADAIVVGTVNRRTSDSVTITVSNNFQNSNIPVASNLLIKDPRADQSSDAEKNPLDIINIAPGRKRIFFIKRSGNDYIPADANYPSIDAATNVTGDERLPDLWLAVNLIAKLSSNSISTSPVYGTFRSGYFNPQQDNNEILMYLQSLPKKYIRPLLLQQYASATVDSDRLWLATALMNIGEIDGLPVAVSIVAKNYARLNSSAMISFSQSLNGLSLADPGKAHELANEVAPLFNTGDIRLIQFSMSALRINPSQAAMPYFKQGLDSTDFATRYYAVCGLAKQTRQGTITSVANYKNNEEQIDRYWRDWISDHGYTVVSSQK